jgi:hypothetical protein
MDPYPCTSNIAVTCQYFLGLSAVSGWTQVGFYDKIVATFSNTNYSTSKLHILIPDMQTAQYNNKFWYHVGLYNFVTKDYLFSHSGTYYRAWNLWSSTITTNSYFYADITGKAGSYRKNVTIYVNDSMTSTGGNSFVIICTNWSLF